MNLGKTLNIISGQSPGKMSSRSREAIYEWWPGGSERNLLGIIEKPCGEIPGVDFSRRTTREILKKNLLNQSPEILYDLT